MTTDKEYLGSRAGTQQFLAKSVQHLVFQGGLPSQYYPGSTVLDLTDLTGCRIFTVIWSYTRTQQARSQDFISEGARRNLKHSWIGGPDEKGRIFSVYTPCDFHFVQIL